MKTLSLIKKAEHTLEKFNARTGRLIVIDSVNWKWSVGISGLIINARSELGEIRSMQTQWGWRDREPIRPSYIEKWLRQETVNK